MNALNVLVEIGLLVAICVAQNVLHDVGLLFDVKLKALAKHARS